MEPVPVLVVAGRQLLVRMRAHQRRVDIERDRRRARARVPHPRPRRPPRRAHLAEQLLVDRLQHPVRRRLRRARTDNRSCPRVGLRIGHAITAVSQHHRHVSQHPPRIMRRLTLPRRSRRFRQRPGEPAPVNSTSNSAPACDTNPSPSAVTSTVPTRVIGITCRVSSPGRYCGSRKPAFFRPKDAKPTRR